MGVVPWNEINRYFIDAYCEAARAEVDMRSAANALESLREAVFSISAGASIFDVWATFDKQIGIADLDRFMPVLVKLRQEFKKIALEREVFRVNRMYSRGETEGWQAWLDAYTNTFDIYGWRTHFGLEITRQCLRSSPFPDWSLNRILQAVDLVNQGRWAETYDWFCFLMDQDLPAHLRARMAATAAEIQLYHFLQPTKARQLLERGDTYDKKEHRLKVAWGEYWMQVGEADKARQIFEDLLSQSPDSADGFVNLGDYYDNLGETDRAEDYYNQAVGNAPGMVAGYRRLMNFYGKPSILGEQKDRLQSLLKRTLALDEDQAYSWVSLGLIYKDSLLFDQARRYFERAIREDPKSVIAHIWLGYNYLAEADAAENDSERKKLLFEQARLAFARVVELAPDAIDGHWGFMRLAHQLNNWEEALAGCNRCLQIHPEWESFVLVERSDKYQRLKRFEDAERDLLRSLEIEPINPGALDHLSVLADSYKISGVPDLSLRALDALRQYKKDLEEHTYQNRKGNIHYYFEEYPAAAECYRLALAAQAEDDVLHSNLALALERIEQPGKRLEIVDEAIQHLKRAIELNPEYLEYSKRLETLEIEREVILAYGENARKYTPEVTGIRIKIHQDIWQDVLGEDMVNLSPFTLEKIAAMRKRVLDLYGVNLPGILYSPLDDSTNNEGRYEIYFHEIPYDFNYLEPGKKFVHLKQSPELDPDSFEQYIPYGFWVNDMSEIEPAIHDQVHCVMTVSDYILFHLERLAAASLPVLVDFEQIASLLNRCDEATVKAIKTSSQEMLRYWQAMLALLGKRVPMVNIQEISQAYLEARKDTDQAPEIAERLALKFQPV
mgnify:CR=1 FL=1